MTAITLIVTAAGRAALVNAAAAGTNAVTIAAAGLTSTAFVADAAAVALPGEFARVAPVSGEAVDPATIHLIIRDDSARTYALRGFGLFLANGTLFALYGQADAILEKTASSTALLAVDVRFADIDSAVLEFGDTNFLNPPASTEVQGVVELATNAEALAGADVQRAVTPAGIKAVIDSRFGANAASEFVRTLLDRASASQFRERLNIKSAALRDEGSGNGLNADMVDGLHVSGAGAAGGTWPHVPAVAADGVMDVGSAIDFHSASNDPANFTARLALFGSDPAWSSNRMWHAGNDGTGSGLDADLLDGIDSAAFLRQDVARQGWRLASTAGGPTADDAALILRESGFAGAQGGTIAQAPRLAFRWSGRLAAQLVLTDGQGLQLRGESGGGFFPFGCGALAVTGSATVDGAIVWYAGNDGSGSGLDADLLDGRDAVSFANASHQHSAPDLAPAFEVMLGATGYERRPGGVAEIWGQYRGAIAGEPSIEIVFPTRPDGSPVFSEAPFAIVFGPINPTGSNNRDTTIQTQSRTRDGFTFKAQNNGGAGANLDGFDWVAKGRWA